MNKISEFGEEVLSKKFDEMAVSYIAVRVVEKV